jgi:hypothetical protein
MFARIATAFTAIVFAMTTGCAGKDFVRPDSTELKNGQTTYDQIVEQFGKPSREGTVLKNEKMVTTASYAYASVAGKSHRGGTGARGMGYYFFNDILVGYEFISSFEEDHTDFDEMKISQIIEGTTTLDEVIQLLGKPSGYYTYPLIEAKTDEAAVYAYSDVRGTFKMKLFQKLLVVTYDDDRVVTKVEYTSSGSN